MPYLLDTNIFLEILLNQEKKEKAKEFDLTIVTMDDDFTKVKSFITVVFL